jgi:hypothetical protein
MAQITWLGHDSFRSSDDKVIYINPWQIKGGPPADLILVTHDHYDHVSFDDIRKIRKEDTVVACARSPSRSLSRSSAPCGPAQCGGTKPTWWARSSKAMAWKPLPQGIKMTTDEPNTPAIAAEPVQLTLPLAREAPRAARGRRSIEADFPILEVSRLTQLESCRKNFYPAGLRHPRVVGLADRGYATRLRQGWQLFLTPQWMP